MAALHILQGGLGDDKKQIEISASRGKSIRTWIAPKSAVVGDDAVLYFSGHGFFATARIMSPPKKRADWRNRYSTGLNSIELIHPPISIAIILRNLPALNWAKYPRSITTPSSRISDQIRKLIEKRRKTRLPDIDEDTLKIASRDELRAVALAHSSSSLTPRQRSSLYFARSRAIHRYVIDRAEGACEGCKEPAPFIRPDGSVYLEPHHIKRVADEGPDHPNFVIALCPNCHRRAHHSSDAKNFQAMLEKTLSKIERR